MYRQGQNKLPSKSPLDCDLCKELEYYPDVKCCFNCSKNTSICEVWHSCGRDCPEWEGEVKVDGIPTELKDTVDMMLDANYKERFKAEYYQIKIRCEKLKEMMQTWNEGELEFVPRSPKQIFDIQLASMTNYLISLELRAQYEGIVLNKGE